MSGIAIVGTGAVSPAGWNVTALRESMKCGEPVAARELQRPGWRKPLQVRTVPRPVPALVELRNPRMRRASANSQFVVSAAAEAFQQAALNPEKIRRIGIIFCTTCGSVNYSRRYYSEVLEEPALASPLVFPETVFNAPASHLSAVWGNAAVNYTLVGDAGVFVQGLARAAELLANNSVDACLVAASEETDWLTSDVLRHFSSCAVTGEGAGAMVLVRAGESRSPVNLAAITTPGNYTRHFPREVRARQMASELMSRTSHGLLVDGCQSVSRMDAAEIAAWSDWQGARLSPKRFLGEGFSAATAWQCIAAVEAVRAGADCALVSVAGLYQYSIGMSFIGNRIP